jgi:hypothetical protein
MALQSSGAISISQIRNEQVNNGGFGSTYSLRTLSSNASKSTPDAMSEFYSYTAASNVDVVAYMPSYCGCGNYYTFCATTAVAVNTTLTVTMNWYGDLGGYMQEVFYIYSGASCGSISVYSGTRVNCNGEYRNNEYWSVTPTSSGNQNYTTGITYYNDLVPC